MNNPVRSPLIFLLSIIFAVSLISCNNGGSNIASTDVECTSSTVTTESTTEMINTADVTTESIITVETTAEKTDLTLRIGSYNIANGKMVSHAMSAIAYDILEQDLDIVGIQEVDRLAKRSNYIDTMQLLSKYTGYQYYYYTKTKNIAGNEAGFGHEGEDGTGILSKYPILEAESIFLYSEDYEPRALSYVKLDVNGTIINFFNTHLTPDDEFVRYEQMGELAEKLNGIPNCIITGDFNIGSFGEYRPLTAFMTLSCTSRGNPPTYAKNGASIDNIIFSNEFTLIAVDSVKNDHSDHYLLWAELKIKISE